MPVVRSILGVSFDLAEGMGDGLGKDIKDVFTEFGIPYTILKFSSSGEVTDILGEKLDYETNSQVTKPFIREFFLEASVAYDTELAAGDLVRFNVDGRLFLVMNLTPELFENKVVVYSAVLYKCNEICTIQRLPDNDYGVDFQPTAKWRDVFDGIPCLLTEKLYGTSLVTEQEWGDFGVKADECHLPGNLEIKTLDRIRLSNDEYFKVNSVEKRKFDNVNVLNLSEDTRE